MISVSSITDVMGGHAIFKHHVTSLPDLQDSIEHGFPKGVLKGSVANKLFQAK